MEYNDPLYIRPVSVFVVVVFVVVRGVIWSRRKQALAPVDDDCRFDGAENQPTIKRMSMDVI